jgi:hypothetical protein
MEKVSETGFVGAMGTKFQYISQLQVVTYNEAMETGKKGVDSCYGKKA